VRDAELGGQPLGGGVVVGLDGEAGLHGRRSVCPGSDGKPLWRRRRTSNCSWVGRRGDRPFRWSPGDLTTSHVVKSPDSTVWRL
jgi:hypothetical protein